MAIEMLRHDAFDIVLTDLFGYQPAVGIAAIRPVIETAGPIPVGALTGHRVSREQAQAAGLAFVMSKPFEVDDLLAQIDETLHEIPAH
jgi:CheY-like chemotaxis protein